MRVLIIGGGVGGLAAALALRRRQLPVAVYDAAGPASEPPARAEPPARVGPGLWLPPGAMQLFERWGLAGAVQGAGTVLERAVVQTAGGEELWSVNLATGASFEAPSVALSRGALTSLLAERLPAHVLNREATCEGFSETEEQVTRRRLFPSAAPRETGRVSHWGIAPAPTDDPSERDRVLRDLWGKGARFVLLPVERDRVFWCAVQRASRAPRPRPNPDDAKASLADDYVEFPGPTGALIDATPAEAITRVELQDLAPLDQWHRGRVGLLGDAAHAASPALPARTGRPSAPGQSPSGSLVPSRAGRRWERAAAALRRTLFS
ncbi:MAG: hypothetical protein BRD29_01915 [Bacteroidetes bacterium QH_2_67_10]|nr:MAG: hypothetical protein BRD29_01915 [Bacteroidetes bacterium QH_2_67_10]